MTLPISVIMVTKNEAMNIEHSLPPLINAFAEVLVVDSKSDDDTVQKAKALGANTHHFKWNGQYPKKRQWCLDNLKLKHDWVLMIDADEIITDPFVEELKTMDMTADAYFIKSTMVWNGKPLKYGMPNNKLCLFKKSAFHFPVIDDLDLDGMGEIEGHYQPVPIGDGAIIGQINAPIQHHNRMDNWHDRHDNYATWEIAMNKRNAWPVDPIFKREFIKDSLRTSPLKPYLFFLYGYVIKLGFLDGKAGLDYALKRSLYYQRIVRAT